MKTFALVVLALLIIGLGLILLSPAKTPAPAAPAQQSSYMDATYSIDGTPMTLKSPGITYFGNSATGDLNGDGKDDVAFIFTYSGGGSGTFYYVVAALKTSTGYQGTNAVLLGDRVAPQPTQIEYGEVVANYADRAASEPMTTPPSVGVSKYLQVTNGQLAEIPANEYAAGNLLLGTDATKALGTYLIGSSAMTLYTSAKDTPGVSNCLDTCPAKWLPYIIATTSPLANLQAGIGGVAGAITRPDGSLQVTYNGAPLYFYTGDTKPGDTKGQGIGGAWSVAKP